MKSIETDVVVLGGGIAGLAAAVKAGRLGVRVILVERYPFIGGMATAGMVSPFMRYAVDEDILVKGVFADLQKIMQAKRGMVENGFRTDAFRYAARDLLEAAGVQVWTGTELIQVSFGDKRINRIQVLQGNQLQEISAQIFIDTSGDAQLVQLAGLPLVSGREGSGVSQKMTLFFRMGGIDFEPILNAVRANPEDFFDWVRPEPSTEGIISIAGYFEAARAAHAAGALSPEIEYLFFNSLPGSGEASFNTTAISDLKSISSSDLTTAEALANSQVHQVVDLLRSSIQGFEQSYLIETATQIGVRESRRIIGDQVVEAGDIRSGRKFEERIARGCYGIDIHGNHDEEDVMEELGQGVWYDVPRGALVVVDADNILAAGRCLSATFEAHGALRIMPTSAATGEACGAWAALAVKQHCDLREVPLPALQDQIRHNIEQG